MANFNAILNHILGIVFIIIVFSLAYAYLKPHQLHKRRLVSTLLLKGSYLLYLLILLIIIYLSALVNGGLEKFLSGWNSLLSLLCCLSRQLEFLPVSWDSSARKERDITTFLQLLTSFQYISILVMYFI